MKVTEFTLSSRLGDVLSHPVGNDILTKVLLQLGWPSAVVDNPLVRSLRVSVLPSGLAADLVRFLNQHPDRPTDSAEAPEPAWWKEAVVYQIYPRTFCDSNGDGVGDLPGVLSRLDRLQALGVTALWLSPIYDSPLDDNGYDIRDYRAVLREFGTLEDLDLLVAEAHRRGLRVILDLVLNHTSDEHAWFQRALRDPQAPERSYYHLVEGPAGSPPNNWTSFFGGSAWRHFPEAATVSGQGLWGLHLFSPKQLDLNWENPSLRKELYAMVRWWLDRGIDGFRLDVINNISKQPGLPAGSPLIGALMGYTGIEHYFYGPRLHEFLRELRREAWAGREVFAVGETPGPGLQMSRLLTEPGRGELDVVFNFDHLENPGKVRFDTYRYDLRYLAREWSRWQTGLGAAWNSLYLENHDNPRMVSKVDPPVAQRAAVAKLLAVFQLTLRGTPFVFQGQERGSVNRVFTSVDEVDDIESRNKYAEVAAKRGVAAALRALNSGSRDHGRQPLEWTEPVGEVEAFYRRAIALRRAHPALVYGDFNALSRPGARVFVFRRSLGDGVWHVALNLRGTPGRVPKAWRRGGFDRLEAWQAVVVGPDGRLALST